MLPHIQKMRENIAGVLGIQLNQINVKATTEEGLGFTGSGEGISSQAICALTSVSNYIYGEADMKTVVPDVMDALSIKNSKSD